VSDLGEMIADYTLLGQNAGSDYFSIRIEIGRPYKGEGHHEWICPMKIDPLHNTKHIHGEGSLQALCLALSMAHALLMGFVEDGGTLWYAPGDEFQLENFWPNFSVAS
jgi:hypothetical protein